MGQQKTMAQLAKADGIKKVSFAWIPLNELELMPHGNRRVVNEARVDEIATGYDSQIFGVVMVGAKLPSGKYRVADGQHRVLGLRKRGWKEQPIPCVIVHGAVTTQQMAAIFLGIQRRLNVKPVDVLLNEILAEQPEAVAINKIVRDGGFRIGHTTTNGTISAAAALKRIYRVAGAEALAGALMGVTDTWGKTPAALRGEILEGWGLVLGRYPTIDRSILSKKLRPTDGGADGILAFAKSGRHMHGSTIPQNIAAVMVTHYNSGRKPENRLPDWWVK